jgi:formylglycine-generating enzyme
MVVTIGKDVADRNGSSKSFPASPRACLLDAALATRDCQADGDVGKRSFRNVSVFAFCLWSSAGGLLACGRNSVETQATTEAGVSSQTPPPSLISAPKEIVDASVDVAVPADASAACPADMALVDGLFCPGLAYRCLKRSGGMGHGCPEYSRGQVCLGQQDHRRYCIDLHEWPNRVGEKPRVFVDWNEAKALCSSVGKRLCRRSEWILACEGPKRLPYPWGFVRQPSPCNIDRAVVEADVNALSDPNTHDEEFARLWQADPIGSHPNCMSSYGVYDLTGNVDEWTDNQADDPGTDRVSTLNGGYWGPVRNTCRLTTSSHGPTFSFYQVGFRCCADTQDGVVVDPPRPFIEKHERKGDEASSAEGAE